MVKEQMIDNDNKFNVKLELNLTLEQATVLKEYMGVYYFNHHSKKSIEEILVSLINQDTFVKQFDLKILKEAKDKAGPQYKHYFNDFIIEHVAKQIGWRNKDGHAHRIDGPAHIDEAGVEHYFLDGEEVSKEEHERLVKLKAFW
jgi:hypothetical protein